MGGGITFVSSHGESLSSPVPVKKTVKMNKKSTKNYQRMVITLGLPEDIEVSDEQIAEIDLVLRLALRKIFEEDEEEG